MNPAVLSLMTIVLAQVVAFQFASIRLGRAMPDAMVGASGLPEAVAGRVREFRDHAGRLRRVLGAILCLAVVAIALVIPLGDHARKIGLAAVSLVSSAALALAYVLDYQKVMAMARLLPEPDLRAAPLRRRTLGSFYHPAWESIPAGVYLATIVYTIWSLRGGATGSLGASAPVGPAIAPDWTDVRAWIQPIIGAILLCGLFALSLHRAVRGGCVTPQSKPFHASLEEAIEYDLRLKRLEMRYGLFARIGIALLLGIIQIRVLASLRGGQAGAWTTGVLLAVLIVLMVSFGFYSRALGRARRD